MYATSGVKLRFFDPGLLALIRDYASRKACFWMENDAHAHECSVTTEHTKLRRKGTSVLVGDIHLSGLFDTERFDILQHMVAGGKRPRT